MRSTPARSKKVHLQHHATDAKAVCVAGSFNNRQPHAAPMQRQADGLWTIELELPPGPYEYRFLADGCSCDAPNATGTASSLFGGRNAVLRVSATI